MKRPATVLLTLLAALPALAAFDYGAWMEKRRLLTAEAHRLHTAYTNCVAQLKVPAEDVTIPIETHPDGSIKTVVHAAKAQYFDKQGLVWAENMVMRKFKKDGSLDVRIDAERCVIDRFAKSAWADGPAKIVQKSTVFTGQDVYFSSPEGYIKVFRDSDLKSKNLKTGGLRP